MQVSIFKKSLFSIKCLKDIITKGFWLSGATTSGQMQPRQWSEILILSQEMKIELFPFSYLPRKNYLPVTLFWNFGTWET